MLDMRIVQHITQTYHHKEGVIHVLAGSPISYAKKLGVRQIKTFIPFLSEKTDRINY